MAKRMKSDEEKQIISRLWHQRKRYHAAKEDFDDLCSWVDGERMRKAAKEMRKLRVELRKLRTKNLRRAA